MCTGAIVATSRTAFADDHQPTITVELEDDEIDEGETTAAEVVLSELTEEWVGYKIEVAVDPDVARIVDVELDDWASEGPLDFEEAIEYEDDDSGAEFGAMAGGQFDVGDTDILLGTVHLEGVGDGATSVDVVDDRLELDNDEDGVQHLDTEIEAATLTVGDGPDDGDGAGEATDDGLPGFGVGAALAGIAAGIGYAVGGRPHRGGDAD